MYTLRFPFRTTSDHGIVEDSASLRIDNVEYSLKFTKPWWSLEVNGLTSDSAAELKLAQLWVGLQWVLLKHEIPSKSTRQAQSVYYTDDPIVAGENLSHAFGGTPFGAVDGMIYGNEPVYFESQKRIRAMTFGDIFLSTATPASTTLASIIEGLGFSHSERLIEAKRLCTALELFAAYFTESTTTARFLSLIMSLEVLADHCPLSPRILALVQNWKSEIGTIEIGEDLSQEDAESLESLHKILDHASRQSHRKRIANLVRTSLCQEGKEEADICARRALKLYDVRGGLVHDGVFPAGDVGTLLDEAKNLVHRVLRAQFLEAVS